MIVAFRRCEKNLPTFLYELNYATLHKTTYPSPPEAIFNAAATIRRVPTYPTGVLLTQAIPHAKQDLLLTALLALATLKTLFT